MLVLLICLVLGLIPLLGVAYIIAFGGVDTVDSLFTILILLTMSGIFFLNVLLELRQRRAGATAKGKAVKPARAASAAGAAPVQFQAAAGGEVRTESGMVVEVKFFEAHVGLPNKSIVTFQPNGAASAHVIALTGDLRNALPTGKRVKISYTAGAGEEGNQLLAVE